MDAFVANMDCIYAMVIVVSYWIILEGGAMSDEASTAEAKWFRKNSFAAPPRQPANVKAMILSVGLGCVANTRLIIMLPWEVLR